MLNPPWVYPFHPEVTSSLKVDCGQGQSAQVLARPNNIDGEAFACTKWIGGSTNGAYYIIDKKDCPVDDYTYSPADACSAELETTKGVPGNACAQLPVLQDPNNVMKNPAGESCFRQKMALLGIPYNGPTASYRTADYQKHLGDLWKKNEEHKKLTDPTERQLCAERRTKIENEMKAHGITDRPYGESHESGKAFDVSNATVERLDATLSQRGSSILAWLLVPPPRTCNLGWGGDFQPGFIDRVHFQLF